MRDEKPDGKEGTGGRPTGRQPQHPGQPARYTEQPGARDPGALAKEGKAEPRPIPDPED